jgi:hypothetical protein
MGTKQYFHTFIAMKWPNKLTKLMLFHTLPFILLLRHSLILCSQNILIVFWESLELWIRWVRVENKFSNNIFNSNGLFNLQFIQLLEGMFSLKNAPTPNFTKKLQAVSTNKYKKKGQSWYFSRQSQKFTTSLTLNNLQNIVRIHQSLRTK